MKSRTRYSLSRKTIPMVLIFISFSVIVSFVSLKTNKPVNSLKVMSYNIHYAIGMDGKYDLERIAKVISKSNPDIVGLQEIGDSTMAANLGKLTGMYYVFGPSKESMKEYGDAILSKFPFEWVGNYSIPSASSSRYQVMGVDIDLSSIYGKDTKVRFLNTHFDWLKSIGSQESRLASVDVIERGFLKGNDLPLILTGDLNAQPNSPPISKLEAKGWVTKNGGSELNTIPSEDPKRRIDYVLVSPYSNWIIDDIKVLKEPIASDHLPVLMTLVLKK